MTKSSKKRFRPGEVAPASGQYQVIGPNGHRKGEVTVVKGEPFPPQQERGCTYELVDPSDNKSGRGG